MGTSVKKIVCVAVLTLVGAGFVGCDSDTESTFNEGGAAGEGGTTGGGSGTSGTGGVTFLDSSGGTGQGDAGATGNCPDWGDRPDCTACLKSNCCSQVAACNNDPGCKAFVECTRPCPDPNTGTSECVQACVSEAGSSGIDAWNAAVVCMGNPCKDTCAHL